MPRAHASTPPAAPPLQRYRDRRDFSLTPEPAPAPTPTPMPTPTPGGAVPAPLPDTLSPQLATLVSALPDGGRWIYESKFDGYRLMARIEGGVPRLVTRGGHDWTARMPALARALQALGAGSAWLDGEIVVAGTGGAGDFNQLQNAFEKARGKRADGATQAIEYRVFDLPYFEGHDLREAPLYARRELLAQWLQPHAGGLLRLSEALGDGPGELGMRLLKAACSAHQEGLIAKRADAPYRSARNSDWLKLKCQLRQEFVVAGYTERGNDAGAVGSLILGVHDDAGRVQPTRVAEVSFAEWTPAGQIRHAVFMGLRSDKPARAITRERPAAPPANPPDPPKKSARAGRPQDIQVTNADRVIDPSTGHTKLDLVRYYASVAEFMLPHLQGRPVAVLRAPGGVGGPQFFQRHAAQSALPGLHELDPALWPGHEPLIEVRSHGALLEAAQMNVVEFHTWNSKTTHLLRPDRMVFDLDPGEGVAFQAVQEGAMLTRALLSEIGLQSWLKTSGGQGLHVVVPLAPRWDFDTVKAFARAVVAHLARTLPTRFVVKSGPANRRGRIFVDYLRNGEGATTVTAFSARARPGLGVSMPVAWDELPGLRSSAQWTIAQARDRLSLQHEDPWAALHATRQSLGRPMEMLGFERPAGGGSKRSGR